MSGRLLPATRLRMSLSKSGVAESLTLMPAFCAHGFTMFSKFFAWSPVNPYITSTVSSPPPLVLPPLLPPLLRHAAVVRTTSDAAVATATARKPCVRMRSPVRREPGRPAARPYVAARPRAPASGMSVKGELSRFSNGGKKPAAVSRPTVAVRKA
jgi:hypothetical protein